MNNQKSRISFKTLLTLLSLFGCVLVQSNALAQTATFNVEAKYRDYIIPSTDKEYLVLTAVGGGGGVTIKKEVSTQNVANAYLSHDLKNESVVMAGDGAYLQAYFKIGNAPNQLMPGSTLRMIVGDKGSDVTGLGTLPCSSGGGGGTGIAYKKKNSNEWILLMVAGGGAGSGTDLMYGDQYGTAGQAYVAGEEGDGKGGRSGGTDPNKAGGGAGAFGSDNYWVSDTKTVYGKHAKSGWQFGPDEGEPTGGASVGGDPKGGWGFGAGGNGVSNSGYTSGGGGYTGGGYASVDGGTGEGGTSYLNEDFAKLFISTDGTMTTNTSPGYIKVEAANELPLDPAIKLLASTNKCIAVESDELHDGNNMYIWDCTTYAKTQSWKFEGNEIKLSYDNNKCVNIDGASTKNGANIRIKNCNNTNAQKWIYDGLTKNIRSQLNAEKCIDLVNAKNNNGNNIQLWDCESIVAQRWTIEGAKTISNPSSAKYIVPATNSDIAFQSILGARSGSSVRLGTKDNSNKNTEQWKFDGTQIKYSTSQDLCLSAAQFDNGSDIQLRSCANTPFQQWVYNGMTQQIHSAQAPGKCIEIQTIGDNFENGQNIYLMDCNEVARQKFDIK